MGRKRKLYQVVIDNTEYDEVWKKWSVHARIRGIPCIHRYINRRAAHHDFTIRKDGWFAALLVDLSAFHRKCLTQKKFGETLRTAYNYDGTGTAIHYAYAHNLMAGGIQDSSTITRAQCEVDEWVVLHYNLVVTRNLPIKLCNVIKNFKITPQEIRYEVVTNVENREDGSCVINPFGVGIEIKDTEEGY